DAEQENRAHRQNQRKDEVEGPDSPKASPRRLIDDGDDDHDHADVKDRTQREIDEKRQRTDEAAGIASQHESFEQNEAGRARGTDQTAGRWRSIPSPGVEGPRRKAPTTRGRKRR